MLRASIPSSPSREEVAWSGLGEDGGGEGRSRRIGDNEAERSAERRVRGEVVAVVVVVMARSTVCRYVEMQVVG